MIITTQAILIHCQKYSDRAVILHTYTREGGRTNLMVYGGNKKSALKGLIETPLAIVEISYDNKPGQEMHTLHSISPILLPNQTDSLYLLIQMFISEVIYKTLRQPMADERVYDFLADYIRMFGNRLEDGTSCLQVRGDELQAFMTQFSVLLGYGGEWLDEWNNLNSLKMIQEMM